MSQLPQSDQSATLIRIVKEIKKPGVIGYLTFFVALIAGIAGVCATLIYKRQLETSREQEKIQFRAYVGAEALTLTSYNKPKFLFDLEAKNFGTTPGAKVAYRYDYDFFIENDDNSYNFSEIKEWKNERGSIVFPNNSLTYSNTINLNTLMLDYLSRADGVLVVWGEIKYDDIFDEVHTAPFCFLFDHSALVKTIAIGEKDDGVKGNFCPTTYNIK